MTASPHHAENAIDALLPAAIAEKAEEIGVHKARLDVLSLVALAVLAGAFIALGSMFATTVLAGADGVIPFGVSRLLGGIVFDRKSTRLESSHPVISYAVFFF